MHRQEGVSQLQMNHFQEDTNDPWGVTYGHDIWVVTGRMTARIQAAEMSLPS